ncbi:MAG: indolepyruvate ferredoxin oxidoreductase family protein [Hyphomicrobiaceae bacterium]|nr:indolepyruvate ferredoxin oxidoreductase family protein [Hyphomicrobiaceae bacterium]
MPKCVTSLDSKFDLTEKSQILTGVQAVVRLLLTQKELDRRAGLETAGYISGYPGSPITALDSALNQAKKQLEANDVIFQPGLNEDIAATAAWGTQQAELRGEGKYDGVFGIWYGKGPGVDRAGDIFRHANHAGTSKYGGVLALMGDDHGCESSTCAHQSEFAFIDAMMPILNPSGVQEILDYGVFGYALSRYAGVWVGLKCIKDNIESTATVDGSLDRVSITTPNDNDFLMPPGGLNIRLGDHAAEKEKRLHNYKIAAILAFAYVNDIDKTIMDGGTCPRIGIVSTGKSYLDVCSALEFLNIDEAKANALGIRFYKVGMTWPLEPEGIKKFVQDLELVIVVEEKRSLIETQIKEQLFNLEVRPRVIGKKNENNEWLFPSNGILNAQEIAINIGTSLAALGISDEALNGYVRKLKNLKKNEHKVKEVFSRVSYFCAGCPHNTSTKIPPKARAYAGIGCHYMVQWMDRRTDGFTQMGGEGANWIGEAPFSKRNHVFQNLGDGTYIHSGSLAIRASVAAGATITYKLLYNNAVAMTGGQILAGKQTPQSVATQLLAEGVKRVDVITDEPQKYGLGSGMPREVMIHHRRKLMLVQKKLAEIPGVTVLIYDQTCASEKRRHRKRYLTSDQNKRAFINPAVCEGCGDCGIKSNCVAILPLETELGRKREIDQSSCNKDFSCIDGFCPSFVTLHGASLKKLNYKATQHDDFSNIMRNLPEPTLPSLEQPYGIIVAGIGGTGVVTISAIIGQAAHIDGKGFGSIDMAGIAQKGGAVTCHLKIANTSKNIKAIRVGLCSADFVLGCDLVVAASSKVLETIRPDSTRALINTYEVTTGDFTQNPLLEVPARTLKKVITKRVGKDKLLLVDSYNYSVKLLGDSIFSNMFLLGMAYQLGDLPVTSTALEKAIELNGTDVSMSTKAFRFGRLAVYDKSVIDRIVQPQNHTDIKSSLEDIIALRCTLLKEYQNDRLAIKYRNRINWIKKNEAELTPSLTGLAEAVAYSYYKLLAYKDQYEVARLHTNNDFKELLEKKFDRVYKTHFHLALPFSFLWRCKENNDFSYKITFGSWIIPIFRVLTKFKFLRGTAIDIFSYSFERKLERKMIADYEKLLDRLIPKLSPTTHAVITELASLPMSVKGFGCVKFSNYKKATIKQGYLLNELEKLQSLKEVAD